MNSISVNHPSKSIIHPRVYTSIVFWCLVVFEIFSYGSSYESLMMLLGIRSWAMLLAFCFAAVDFAGLAKLYRPDLRDLRQPQALLFIAWLISACADTGLTYLIVSSDMLNNQNSIMLQQGVISEFTWTVIIPVSISVLVWLMQVFLVVRLSVSVNEND